MMNSLEVHNQVSANTQQIYRIHRSNDSKTAQHLEMVVHKRDVAKQINIDSAINDLRTGNYVKGTIIDYMS